MSSSALHCQLDAKLKQRVFSSVLKRIKSVTEWYGSMVYQSLTSHSTQYRSFRRRVTECSCGRRSFQVCGPAKLRSLTDSTTVRNNIACNGTAGNGLHTVRQVAQTLTGMDRMHHLCQLVADSPFHWKSVELLQRRCNVFMAADFQNKPSSSILSTLQRCDSRFWQTRECCVAVVQP